MRLDELPKEVISKVNSADSSCLAALEQGNIGKARAYARLGVSAILLFLGGAEQKFGRNTLENLKYLSGCADDNEVIEAAERLLGGERNMMLGQKYSINPLEDFRIIFSYLVKVKFQLG